MVTDYIDGFVFENNTLSYFTAAEERVRVNGGTLTNEYVIADTQGNSRVSFEDNGSGVAVVRQENSYYPFGLIMSNGITPATQPNKNLYNAGSEWQNDYSNDLPDYYETFYRNYDAAIGRFVGVDPQPESAESLTPYQYAFNNPGMLNDPMGDLPASALRIYDPYGGAAQQRQFQQDFSTFGDEGVQRNHNMEFWEDLSDAALYIANSLNVNVRVSVLGNGLTFHYAVPYEQQLTESEKKGLPDAVIKYGKTAGIKNVDQFVAFNIPTYNGSSGYWGPDEDETPGVTVHYWDKPNQNFSYPSVIYIDKNVSPRRRIALIQHEYGHTLQFLKHGSDVAWYNRNVAIPSMISQYFDTFDQHNRRWFELEATTLAHDYYGKNSKLNNYDNPTFYTDPLPPTIPSAEQWIENRRQFNAWSSWGH